MANKKQRLKNRQTAEWLHEQVREPWKCINCGKETYSGHYVPPCFGEDGFWICKVLNEN